MRDIPVSQVMLNCPCVVSVIGQFVTTGISIKEMDVVLLASPYEFQFSLEPSLAHPQTILRAFAERNHIAYVDLLAVLQEEVVASAAPTGADERNLDQRIAAIREENPELLRRFWRRYFLDYDHYNDAGHAYVAHLLYPLVHELLMERK